MEILTSNLTKFHKSVFDPKQIISIDSLIHADYFSFLQKYNGGFFFEGSFHIFGNEPNHDYCDIILVNNIVAKEYSSLFSEKFCHVFAEDIFGNLFIFTPKGIELMFIDSGDTEFIAEDFTTAIHKICEEPPYYTGVAFVLDDIMSNKLCNGYRYCPKMPFVLGGDYKEDNLTLKTWTENIRFSASVARQIFNFLDGTRVRIKIDK